LYVICSRSNETNKNYNKNNELLYFGQTGGGDLRGKKELNFDG